MPPPISACRTVATPGWSKTAGISSRGKRVAILDLLIRRRRPRLAGGAPRPPARRPARPSCRARAGALPRPALLRDVLCRARHAHHPAVAVALDPSAAVDPPHRSVRPHDPVVELEAVALGEHARWPR